MSMIHDAIYEAAQGMRGGLPLMTVAKLINARYPLLRWRIVLMLARRQVEQIRYSMGA